MSVPARRKKNGVRSAKAIARMPVHHDAVVQEHAGHDEPGDVRREHGLAAGRRCEAAEGEQRPRR